MAALPTSFLALLLTVLALYSSTSLATPFHPHSNSYYRMARTFHWSNTTDHTWTPQCNGSSSIATNHTVSTNCTTAANSTVMSNVTLPHDRNNTTNHSQPVLPDFKSSLYGKAIVVNRCDFNIQSNLVHAPRPGDDGPPEEILSTIEPDQSLVHYFEHDPNIGVSWKIVRDDDIGQGSGPVQLEWTWSPDEQKTYWDLSMINAGFSSESDGDEDEETIAMDWGIEHAFSDVGLTLLPQVGQRSTELPLGNCGHVVCSPGTSWCEGAYNSWDDWGQQQDCPEDVDLLLTFCNGGSEK